MTTQYEEIERLIVASRNKFRALVDGLEDWVLSMTSDYTIVAVNKALADGLALHPRYVVGRTCHEVMYGFQRPCPEYGFPCPAALALENGRVEMAVHGPRTPGELGDRDRFFEIRAMPVLGGGDNLEDVIVVRRDITPQKVAEIQIREHNLRLEREVEARTRDLVEANEHLTQQRNELSRTNDELLKLQVLKEDLTNMVVHDLKGPLAEIQANLEMMKARELDELMAEFVEAAQLGGNDLLRMITNLLDISRLEENRLVLDREEIAVDRVFAEVTERQAPLARLSGINLTCEADSTLPACSVDRRIFERIINNLLSNALDYTPEGGRVTLSARQENGNFRFEVADTGSGIPEELHQKIFEKFSQGQDNRLRTSSGLGLTFCKMAVEAHGGHIWVESAPGRGSRFIFLVPQPPLGGPEAESVDD